MKLNEGGISIIVPVFNGEYFIETAYKNILNQNLTNFELIFIDNNSTDASVAKINKIQHKDSRVSLYEETTQGAAAARNKGIKNARGEFIHFFDVDDRLFDGALIALKKVLDNYPKVESVFGKIITITMHSSCTHHAFIMHTFCSFGIIISSRLSSFPIPIQIPYSFHFIFLCLSTLCWR